MQYTNYPSKILQNSANRWREKRQNITSSLFECDEANKTKLNARILYLSTDETIKMNQIKFVFKIKQSKHYFPIEITLWYLYFIQNKSLESIEILPITILLDIIHFIAHPCSFFQPNKYKIMLYMMITRNCHYFCLQLYKKLYNCNLL